LRKKKKTPSIINVEEIKLIVKNEIESNFKDKETIIGQPIDNNNNIERRHFIRLESDDEEESFIPNNESKKELDILKKEMLDLKTINEVFFKKEINSIRESFNKKLIIINNNMNEKEKKNEKSLLSLENLLLDKFSKNIDDKLITIINQNNNDFKETIITKK